MLIHRTTCRVIYGDTDKMGVAYHANYLRWFEMGRSELFRHIGLSYSDIEAKGFLLPVSEAWCKYIHPARYDDILVIETSVDMEVRAGMKFDYVIYREPDEKPLVKGYTRHAFMNSEGRVVRPPAFFTEFIQFYQA